MKQRCFRNYMVWFHMFHALLGRIACTVRARFVMEGVCTGNIVDRIEDSQRRIAVQLRAHPAPKLTSPKRFRRSEALGQASPACTECLTGHERLEFVPWL